MASKIKVDTLETADGTGSITLSNQFSGMTTASLPSGVVTEDASGNVGIGVTPESWDTSYTALQVGRTGTLYGADTAGDSFHMTCNAYRDNAGGYNRHIETAKATDYIQYQGIHEFKVAPSGTADSAISFTTVLALKQSGHRLKSSSDCSGTSEGVALFQNTHSSVTNGDEVLRLQFSGTNNASGGHFINFYDSGGDIGRINCSGASSVQYSTSSDYRLKENVTPMSGSIDRLKELKPSRFNFIKEPSRTVDGFLAHEAGEVVPESICGEKDAMKMEEYEVTPAVMDGETVVTEAVMGEREVPDMQGIDQAKLVPLLTSALQDAIAKIEQLESRISALEVN